MTKHYKITHNNDDTNVKITLTNSVNYRVSTRHNVRILYTTLGLSQKLTEARPSPRLSALFQEKISALERRCHSVTRRIFLERHHRPSTFELLKRIVVKQKPD